MALYNFRSKYYDVNGNDLSLLENANFRYISNVVPIGGNGTQLNPNKTYYIGGDVSTNGTIFVFSNGVHKSQVNKQTLNGGGTSYFIGNGMYSTILNLKLGFKIQSEILNFYVKDAYVKEFTTTHDWGSAPIVNIRFYKSVLSELVSVTGGGGIYNIFLSNCIVLVPNTYYNTSSGRNSYLNTDITTKVTNLDLYENCNITILTVEMLNSYLATYSAFSDCKFKIGNELDWVVLSGSDETQIRANFVSRCEAQFGSGLVPVGSEFGDTNMAMYRWVFANNSSKNGVPNIDGIIHNFEKRRFITFGYETKRAGFIVSSNPSSINSFNSNTPEEILEIIDNRISFNINQDITDHVIGKKQSNIMWLGGKLKLTALDIVHNMPIDFGVMVDTTPTINFTPVASGDIQPEELYIIRSIDKQYAAITYNGVGYNTSLVNNTQVFKGIINQTEFTVTQGNPVIYLITDFVQHQTINMRIVNRLPIDIINSGNLSEDYWYFVEHDTDQSNTTDYITYKGVNYMARSSFLCNVTDLTFSVSGNIHLRRCWHKDFDWETMQPGDLDYDFWLNEQKPKWCKIVLGDTPRCFMKSNNIRNNEMQSDEYGEYLTTGNPAFYGMESGNGGIVAPSFLIQGTFMQLSLEVTTINPI